MKISHLVSISGGKDSTAVYLKAIESGRDFRAVFADTGNEHQWTYDFVCSLHEKTGGPKVEIVKADFSKRLEKHRDFILQKWPEHGIPNDVVQRAAEINAPTGNPYLDLCILKGRFPSRKAQFCTEELKVLPITLNIVIPMLKHSAVLQWLGIRASESKSRASQPVYNRADDGSYLWRPIFSWGLPDVWEIHKRHGIKPNPLYENGMGRVGCMPCVNCGKSELKEISERFPEHIQKIAEWESIVSEANKRNSATFFAPGKDPKAQSEGRYPGILEIVEWSKTARGGRQFGLDLGDGGGGCSSDLGLCESL